MFKQIIKLQVVFYFGVTLLLVNFEQIRTEAHHLFCLPWMFMKKKSGTLNKV